MARPSAGTRSPLNVRSKFAFFEPLTSNASVAANGGTLLGGLSVDHGFRLVTPTGQGVVYNNSVGILDNKQKASIYLEWYQANASDYNPLMTVYYGGLTVQFGARPYAGSFDIHINSQAATPAASFAMQSNRLYKLVILFDGTQVGNANRLKVYDLASGTPVPITLTYPGTVGSSFAVSPARVAIIPYDNGGTITWALTPSTGNLQRAFGIAPDVVLTTTEMQSLARSGFDTQRTSTPSRSAVTSYPFVGSLNFRGNAGDYATVNITDTGNPTAWTWFMWVKPMQDTTGIIAELSADVNSNNHAFGAFWGIPGTGVMTISARGTGGTPPTYNYNSAALATKGAWHRVVMTMDPTASPAYGKVYIDGVLSGSIVYGTQPDYLAPYRLYIGARAGSGFPMAMRICNFGLDRRCWSQADVNIDMANNGACLFDTSDPLTWYRELEASGTTIKDYSGNGFDLTLMSNGVTFVQDSPKNGRKLVP